MNLRIKLLFVALSYITCYLCQAQVNYNKQDSVIFHQYIAELAQYRSEPTNQLIVNSAKYFLGCPYVGGTLENEEGEQLTINLRDFDCTTFVENCIALSKEIQKGDNATFRGYTETLKEIRYRDAIIDGYTSRLHYVSDWIYEKRELLDNITLELGGKIVNKPLSFMSSKSHLYPSLKADKENLAKIKAIETAVNKRNNYTLLSIPKLKQVEKQIKAGDIVIFGTNVQGLDYSHMGIAFWEGNILKLLHASSAKKEVIIDTKSLVQYCENSKTCTGITVLRLK